VPFKFTRKIKRVNVELKAATTADAIEAEKARRQAAIKAAMSN